MKVKSYIITIAALFLCATQMLALTDAEQLEKDRQQLLAALERFENDYNLQDGTDYSRVTMSATAWNSLIKAVDAASVALDDNSAEPDYITAREALVAQLDATDASLRLFKSYQSMLNGIRSLGLQAANTYSASSYTNTDIKLQSAVEGLNRAFKTYADKQATDIDASVFLGTNLDFNTPQGDKLVASSNIYDVVGWDEIYSNTDEWCFIQNSNADHDGQLYLRANWTDKAVILKVQKQSMLPEGKYTLSLSWNSDLTNMKNLSTYVLNGRSRTITKKTTTAQTLTYTFEVADSPATFDLTFGFQKKNSGNAPAQILVDDIRLTRLYVEPTAIETVENEKMRYPENEIYDLSGRKITVSPISSTLSPSTSHLKKGIYIINGKKIIK